MLTLEQQARRKQGIGASELGAILGLSKWKTPLDVYMDKLGLTEPSEDSEAAEWGHRLEPVIAQKYAARNPGVLLAESDTVAHPQHPWALATPDRIAYDERDEWLVEIKTREDRTAGEFGEPGTDQVPEDVLVQCQWQMFVTGKRRCDVALLVNGRRFTTYTVLADDALQQMLYERAERFWFLHVVPQLPPEVTAQDNASIVRLFPKNSGKLVEGGADVFEKFQKLAQLRAEMKTLEQVKDETEAVLKLLIGETDGFTFPNGSKLTWLRNKDSEVTDWKAVAFDLAGTISGDPTKVDEVLDTYVPEHTKTKPGARVLRTTVKEN